jgi:hypothetical protein
MHFGAGETLCGYEEGYDLSDDLSFSVGRSEFVIKGSD